jgi:hypothetical protein
VRLNLASKPLILKLLKASAWILCLACSNSKYNFKAVGDIAPYVGLGYAKVKGNWYKSYYRGTPGPDANYGMKGICMTGMQHKNETK